MPAEIWLGADGNPVNDATYHGDMSVWGSSMIRKVASSPRLVKAMTDGLVPQMSDEATIGTVGHRMLFAPDEFAANTAIWEDGENGARKGKVWDEFKAAAEAAGKDIIRRKDLGQLPPLIEAIKNTPDAAAMIMGPGPCEQPIIWTDPETGLRMKCKPDKRVTDALLLPDLKTTGIAVLDAEGMRRWRREAAKKRVHWQMDHYREGVFQLTGDWYLPTLILVSQRPPYAVRIWEFPESTLEVARRERRAALIDIARRLDSGDWSDPQENQIHQFALEPWEIQGDGDDDDESEAT